jgi:hypothetical protein
MRSKDKGNRGERKTVKEIREVFPDSNTRRGDQSRSGKDAPDVFLDGYWIEVKTEKARPSWGKYESAMKQADEAKESSPVTSVVVFRENFRAPMAAIRVEDLFSLGGGKQIVLLPWLSLLGIIKDAS